MHMVMALRGAVICGALALVSACTSTNQTTELAGSPADPTQAANAGEAQGTEAPFCPRVSLREGTAILRKEKDGAVDYVASISDTTRDCRIVDGKLRITVGAVGRLMPGPAATARTVQLPVRVAVTQGDSVVYSNLGKIAVPVAKGGVAQTFRYIDSKITIPDATNRNVVIYTGFDEGPPE